MVVDNQIRVTTDWGGLRFIQAPPQENLANCAGWSDWREWPHLSVTADQGSDGFAAIHALQRHFRCNLSYTPDASHGVHRDLMGALRSASLMEFMLLVMVAMNLQHGPWGDDSRWQQMKESAAQLWAEFTPATCPLWHERGPAIAQEILEPGVAPDGEQLQKAWEKAASSGLLEKKGYTINLNRFMGVLDGATELLQVWTAKLMVCEYVALEGDMVGSERFVDTILGSVGDDPTAEEKVGTTSSSTMAVQDKMLRQTAQHGGYHRLHLG